MVRWKAEDLAVTGVCRGSRGFTMVGRGAAPKKTPETQESEMTDLAPTKIGGILRGALPLPHKPEATIIDNTPHIP